MCRRRLGAIAPRLCRPGSRPHLRRAQLFEQQVAEVGRAADAEEPDAPAGAVLAQALDVVGHALLIGLQPVLAEGHLGLAAVLGIDEAQVAERRRVELFRREDLHAVDLEAAADQGVQPGLVARRVEEIAEDDGDAGLPGLRRCNSLFKSQTSSAQKSC